MAYTGVFALTITMVAVSQRTHDATVAHTGQSASTANIAKVEPAHVDEATALHIASNIAAAANLPIANNLTDKSKSVDVEAELAASNQIAQKPLLVRAVPYSREVQNYTTKEGDSVDSIAKEHNISTQTVKWANNLTSDAVESGKNIAVLPLDGIQYTVKDGDTVESISSKYKADVQRVTSYNDLELSKVTTGQKLIIPDGILPEEERPGYVAPAPVAAPAPVETPVAPAAPVVMQPVVDTSAGNTYAYGNCTFYAYARRMQLGRPIGSNWGNAATWNAFARQQGFRVDKSPEAGAIFQMPAFVDAWTSEYGHVGIVESVNGDGSVNVSEMNYAGGFNTVSYRTIPAAQAAMYNYIH